MAMLNASLSTFAPIVGANEAGQGMSDNPSGAAHAQSGISDASSNAALITT